MEMMMPGGYLCVVTDTPDESYRKFLSRKCGLSGLSLDMPQGLPLDISIHDREDEIVAGLSAVTRGQELLIDLIWLGDHMRHAAFGSYMAQIAEQEARRRACRHAQVHTQGPEHYLELGYQLVPLPDKIVPFATDGQRRRLYLLQKDLA